MRALRCPVYGTGLSCTPFAPTVASITRLTRGRERAGARAQAAPERSPAGANVLAVARTPRLSR